MDLRELSKKFASGALSPFQLGDHEMKFWKTIEERTEAGERVDAHRARAAYELGIPESAVTPDQRRDAKQLNYYRMYTTQHFEVRPRAEPATAEEVKSLLEGVSYLHAELKVLSAEPATAEEVKSLLEGVKHTTPCCEEEPTKIQSKICSNVDCGKEFVCSGDGTCWCMGLDTKKAIDPTKDCMCPDCMKKL